MSTVSTHVLDTALGKPAQGVRVYLSKSRDATMDAAHGGPDIGSAVTDTDGRAKGLQGMNVLSRGKYVLRFEIGSYFATTNRDTFYDIVAVEFKIDGDGQHVHVPLLISPFGYSTYRGS